MRDKQFSRRALLQSAATLGGAAAVSGVLPGAAVAASSSADGDGKNGRNRIIATDNGSIVETQCGKVHGYTRNGIHIFKGIPYGASTEGKNRFMPPHKTGAMDRHPECALLRAGLSFSAARKLES